LAGPSGESKKRHPASSRYLLIRIRAAEISLQRISSRLSGALDSTNQVFYILLRDYNASEIGRKLGVGPNAIWQRMKKIRRRLKDALENYALA